MRDRSPRRANAAGRRAYAGSVALPPLLRPSLLLAALAVVAAPLAAQAPAPASPPAPADSSATPDSTAASVDRGPLAAVRAALADSTRARVPFAPLPPALAGVVWTAPADTEAALADLVAMYRAGVRQVRTDLVADTTVLRAASLLGLALWQDLPVKGLPAPFLVDRTAEAGALLAEALDRARPFSAARHFGLARASDTSDPRARRYVEALTTLAHERGAPGTRTYYVSRFPRDDRAAEAADLVLLDARDVDPVATLRQWRARRDTPVGLAAFGTGVRPGQRGGWRTLGTEAAQARALEDAFGALLTLDRPPVAAFVYRWRDAAADLVERDQRAEVTGTRFGLLGDDDAPRPAFDVASGFWTGRQRVFAFDAGSGARAQRRASPLLVIGWLLVLGLGVFYAGAPRLGALAPRYFGRRDLYREAVQRGFDLSAFETTGLAVAVAASAGIVGASALRALGRTDALVAATASWTLSGQARLTGLLGQPLVLVSVLALAFGTWLLLNVIWLYLISGRRRIRAAQALSLAVWPRWAWLPLMAVSLLLGSIDAGLATVLAPTFIGVGLLIEVVAGYRMMWDLQAVTYGPPFRTVVVGFGLPFLIAVAGLVALAVTSRPELGFLWHLATRG